MKRYFHFLVKAIPFTLGMILALVSLCFLVDFHTSGMHFDEEFWSFVILFSIAFPTMIFGINELSEQTPGNQEHGIM